MNNYVPPPPPPRQADNSCWKWGGITCGLGCLLIFLAIGAIVVMMGPKGRAFFGQAMQLGQDSVLCQQEMKILWQQIDRYHREKGKYPDKLKDLVPHYVASESDLHFSKKPRGPEFTYYKPGPNDPDTKVMLEYPLSLTGPDGKVVEIPVQMRIDGHPGQGAAHPSGGGGYGSER